MLLEVRDLHVAYGMIRALRGISLTVGEGEIVTLIGANGAGKSTALRTISGIVRPASGAIVFDGQPIGRLPSHRIARLGLAHVPEGRKPFSNLNVRENLRLGAYRLKDRAEIASSLERVFRSVPRLRERLGQPAGTLSGGELQMLAMGRGLMSRPRLLMLDEPSMGLSPILVEEIFSIIREINQTGTAILVVEQNANMALSIAHRAYVMETGEIVLSGKAAELACDARVQAAYLGG